MGNWEYVMFYNNQCYTGYILNILQVHCPKVCLIRTDLLDLDSFMKASVVLNRIHLKCFTKGFTLDSASVSVVSLKGNNSGTFSDGHLTPLVLSLR